MSKHWFTADPHFSHNNIIRYTDRPFKNHKEMDNVLIKNINDLVSPQDVVYYIGDFSMLSGSRWQHIEKIVSKINGQKVLILGNHDALTPFKYIELGFHSVHTSLSIQLEGYKFIMNHDPSAYCMIPKDCIFLCGHIHNLFKILPDKRTINVGVDVWDYKPVSLETIISVIKDFNMLG